jgi:uncharacterized membrane protein (DUF373 family)
MDAAEADKDSRRVGTMAARAFLRVEVLAYLLLGVMLALVVLFGLVGAGTSLVTAAYDYGAPKSLVVTIDRLLLVLMVVEILHTVRASFRSGSLVGEPFLVVGLIASIRRMLVITLESSQAKEPGSWTPAAQSLFNATMIELGVLAGLILVLVVSIAILRRSEPAAPDGAEP